MKIINLDSLLLKLENLENLDLSQELKKSCLLVENEAKKKCPVDKGDLRRSIHSRLTDPTTGEVYTPTEYAPYVEFGTGVFAENGDGRKTPWHYQDDKGQWHTTTGQHPQPYMRPALDENIDKIKEIFIGGITDNV